MDEVLEDITTVPQLAASAMGKPKPSYSDGSTKTEHFEYKVRSKSSVTSPVMIN
jgi:hypothetical protein